MWFMPNFTLEPDPFVMAAQRMASIPRYRPLRKEDLLYCRPGGIINIEKPSAEAIRAHELLWENT